jgi:lipoate-protein ligase A
LTLEEALGVAVDWQTVAVAVAEGFAQAFDLILTPDDLSPAELDHAERLTAEVYANPDWTFRR